MAAQHGSAALPRVLYIAGATCTGKTQLAVHLARLFDAELVSADSIQCYSHLSIAANKVALADNRSVVHHGISTTPCTHQVNVHDFSRMAHRVISDCQQRGRNCIVVGGNMYWMEAALIRSAIHQPANMSDNNSALAEESVVRHRQEWLNWWRDTYPQAPLPLSTVSSSPVVTNLSGHEPAGQMSDGLADLHDILHQANDSQFAVLLGRMNSMARTSNTCAPSVNRVMAQAASSSTNLPSEKMHRMLQELDPQMAQRLHRNDRRKISRALQVFFEYGQRHSERITSDQLRTPDLFYDACMIWLDCDRTILVQRVRDRVDKMVKSGMLAECEELHELLMDIGRHDTHADAMIRLQEQCLRENTYRKALDPICQLCVPNMKGMKLAFDGESVDITRGIGQALGLKEFIPWLRNRRCSRNINMQAVEQDQTRLLTQCTEALKCSTSRYAAKQVLWILHRIVENEQLRHVLPVHRLDATSQSLDDWNRRILLPAQHIYQALVDGNKLSSEHYDHLLVNVKPLHPPAQRITLQQWAKVHCSVCDREFNGSHEWQVHLASRQHHNRLMKNQQHPIFQT